MDITRLADVVVRRWYVVVPLLLLTVLVVVQVGNRVAPEYQADGSVLFYAPPGDPAVSNPYASPVQAATAMTVVMSGGSSRAAIADRGLDPDYDVEVIEARPGTASSIVSVLVRSDDEATATATRDAVIAQMVAQLEARQVESAVPPAERTRITVLVSPENVSTITTGPLRAQVVVLVFGLALTLLFVVCLDVVLADRSRRRGSGGPDQQRPTPVEGPGAAMTAAGGQDRPVPVGAVGARSSSRDERPSD